MRPSISARQIEVFHAVMRCGTLTAAARSLNVSQPALSQLLQHAETQLGFRLFRRLQGRLMPTPEALRLFPEAERLHREIENFHRLAADLRAGDAGSLRLAASTPAALSFVPRALRSFRAAFPGVRVMCHVVPLGVLAEMVAKSEADLGVAMSDTPRPLIQTERIGVSRIVCLLPTQHRLAALAAVEPADLAEETLLSYRAANLPGTLLEQAFVQRGVRYHPQIEYDVSITAASFVQQGIGVALVDALMPWDTFPGLVTRPFVPETALPVCLLVNAQRPLSQTQEMLRDALRAALRDDEAGAHGRSPVGRPRTRARP